jgi:aryl-alcohol dehydrogenase-like predicted oxidoreductase
MIPTLPFGRTGHTSTRALFGAAAFGGVTQDEADRTMELIFKYGINHIDTAASYGDAEIRLGPWIEKHRKDFFLATKTGDRTYVDAKASIQRSLERMRTDQIDLIQLHAVIEDQEWETAMGPGGALEAAVEAREKGYVRFIGITSHSLRAPMMHKKSLERFDFDSVLLPLNFMLAHNPQYMTDFEALMKVCQERNVAVQLIKTNQRRKWEEGGDRFASTWYEPFTDQESINKAVGWAMASQPGAFLNTSGDIHILPLFLEACARFDAQQVASDEEMQALMQEKETVALWP